MDIFINTDKSPAQLQGKATGSPLSSFRVKRGASVPLSVTILGSDSASGLRMGIKAKGNYEGDLLILAEADSGTPTEYGMRFDLKLVASSVALNDVLDVGEGSATAPATIAAMTEFAWLENGETRLSDTLQTTIINDIIRLGETLLKRENAAEQSVCRESAEAIVPPKRTTPVGRAESRRGQPLKSQNL